MSDESEDDDFDYDGLCEDCDDEDGDVQLKSGEWLCNKCLLARYEKLVEEDDE